jgi:glucokinase
MVDWVKANASGSYDGQELSAKLLCARATQGDEWARRAVEREGYYLGVGLANVVSVFMPDAIVLGGGVMKSADLFFDRIRQVIRENCRLVPFERVELSLASLGPDVALIGAAQVWHHRFAK